MLVVGSIYKFYASSPAEMKGQNQRPPEILPLRR